MPMLIDRYIARLMFAPLAATLIISAMLLLLIRTAELLKLVMAEGGTAATVAHLVADLVPQYLGLGIPVGLLTSVLIAFRRLALNSELDALLGSGVSYWRMLKVPMLFASVLAIVTLAIVGFAQPLSTYNHEKMLFDLRQGSLGVSIKVGEFTELGEDVVVRVEGSSRGGRDLQGLFVSIKRDDAHSIVIFADRGTVLGTERGQGTTIRLLNGTLAHIDRAAGLEDSASFESYEIPLIAQNAPAFRVRGGREREMTFPELLRTATSPDIPAAFKREAEAGICRRLAQMLALFLLPFLALGLARPPNRSASGLRPFVAVSVFIVYNELSLFGERLGFTGQVEPFAAQATLFAGLVAICIGVFFAAASGPRNRRASYPTSLLSRYASLPWQFAAR